MSQNSFDPGFYIGLKSGMCFYNTKSDLNNRFRVDEDIAGVRNTKWGALMAVQAWEQKDKPLKGIKNDRDRTRRHQSNVIFGKLPITEKASKILIKA